MTTPLKTCTKCKKELPRTTLFFSERAGVADGFWPHCKICHSEEAKKYIKKRKISKKKLTNATGYKNPTPPSARQWPYTPAVIGMLKSNPERSNQWIASETGAPYEYVNSVRKKMEMENEIPFVTETINVKGVWRRRYVNKATLNDPWGRTELVYFLKYREIPDSPVRIGWTNNMKQRFATYKMHNAFELEVLKTVNAGAAFEADVHLLFDDIRLHGEWFKGTPDLYEFIRGLPESATTEYQNQLQQYVAESPYRQGHYKPSRAKKKLLAAVEKNPPPDFCNSTSANNQALSG